MCAICGHYGFVRYRSALNCLCAKEKCRKWKFFLDEKRKIVVYFNPKIYLN